MKAFNLVALAIVGAMTVSFGLGMLTSEFLDEQTAMMVTLPACLMLGLSARRITEKILGYTLFQALEEGVKDDSSGT